MTHAPRAALACLAAAAAWPAAMGQLTGLLTSPYERAVRKAWCGAPYHAATDVLGHCAACWTGSALFAVAALWLTLGARRLKSARARL